MRRIALLFWVVSMAFVQQACTSKKQTDSPATDSATAAVPGPGVDYLPEAMPARLASLGLTRDSHWRGINLGDAFSVVKEKEKGEPFESDAKHVGYTVEFPNLETADMLYYQSGGKVSAIDVDLFLNNRQSVDEYRKELEPYFTTRYGTPKTVAGVLTWNGSTGEQLSLKDVSKGKDFGLKIKIQPVSGSVTASTK
jgi:hypothetical protein